MKGTRDLNFYQPDQIKRVRLVKRASGYYVQFCIKVDREEVIKPTHRREHPTFYLMRLVEIKSGKEGLATDPIKYFAAPENADALRSGLPTMEAHQARDLGIVKSIRKPFKKLIIDPFPDRTSTEGSFFFEPSAQTCLTTALVS